MVEDTLEEEKPRTLKGGGCGTQATFSLFNLYFLTSSLFPTKNPRKNLSGDLPIS